MKVSYYISTESGCDYYRAVLPLETAKLKGNLDVLRRAPTDTIMDVISGGHRFKDDMENADIIFVPRLSTMDFARSIVEKKKGKLVLDFDDNIFSVSPMNESYVEYGTIDVKIKIKDEYQYLWKNGETQIAGKVFDIERNTKMLEGMRDCIRSADAIFVTTEELANVYREFNSNIKILPNCVDLNLWRKLPFKESNEIRLFWAGSASHYEDWHLLKNVLPVVMEKYPQVKLVIMGQKFDGTLKGIPDYRIEYHDWAHILAYPYKIATLNPTIGIIPLKDTNFSRCKSTIKWVEMSALEVPCVLSNVTPYKELQESIELDLGVFIEDNDEQAWIKGLSEMIENETLRQSIASSAKIEVIKKYDINTQYKKWITAFEEVLNARAIEPTII